MLLRDVLAAIPKNEEIIVEWYCYNQLEYAQIIRPYGHRDELEKVLDCRVRSIRSDSTQTNPIKKSMLIITVETEQLHFPKE